MYKSNVPDRLRELYISINIFIVAAFFAVRIFVGNIRDYPLLFALIVAAFALFNGIWSANRSLYSWFYRGEKSLGNLTWGFVLMIVTGALLLVAVAVFLIM